MKDVDALIQNCISSEFKTAKQISEEIQIPYLRVAVRLRQMRKREDLLVLKQSNEPHIRGVKPIKYRCKR